MARCKYLQAEAGGFLSSSTYYCGVEKKNIPEVTVTNTCERSYDECYLYKQAESSGGCYLTSACIEALLETFSDNCPELATLRDFRDGYVVKNYPNEIERYYQIAPKIVAAINKLQGKAQIYKAMYENMIRPAISEIEQGNYVEAYEVYKHYSEGLEEKYLLSPTL